jgi:hypothetical protein
MRHGELQLSETSIGDNGFRLCNSCGQGVSPLLADVQVRVSGIPSEKSDDDLIQVPRHILTRQLDNLNLIIAGYRHTSNFPEPRLLADAQKLGEILGIDHGF